MLAASTAFGKGFSQRSGFHSSASSPQSALLRLQALTPTSTLLPFGTKMLSIMEPSAARMGSERVKDESWNALHRSISVLVLEQYHGDVHSRSTIGVGGNLGNILEVAYSPESNQLTVAESPCRRHRGKGVPSSRRKKERRRSMSKLKTAPLQDISASLRAPRYGYEPALPADLLAPREYAREHRWLSQTRRTGECWYSMSFRMFR